MVTSVPAGSQPDGSRLRFLLSGWQLKLAPSVVPESDKGNDHFGSRQGTVKGTHEGAREKMKMVPSKMLERGWKW